MNMAMGYVTFARDEPHLFRFLFADRPLQAAADLGTAVPLDKLVTSGNQVHLADQVPTAMSDPRILRVGFLPTAWPPWCQRRAPPLPDSRIRSLLLESGQAFFEFEKGKETRK